MIIDAHCHIDMLDSPESYLLEKENSGDITLGMTNLPSHFSMGYHHFKRMRMSRLALGYHPQLVHEYPAEIYALKELIPMTSYIGEVGLDFSRDFIIHKELQKEYFDYICQCIQGERKIVSIHSRMAERDVVETLRKYNISTPIFHWYSGPLNLIPQIIDLGGYFSINEAMTLSERGRKIISKIPLDRLLTESDAPYNQKNNIISALHNLQIDNSLIYRNFKSLLNTIK